MDRKSGGGSRRKTVTGGASGGGIFRRGSGLNQDKPVGNASGYEDRRQEPGGSIGDGRGAAPFGRASSGRSFSPFFGRGGGTSGTGGTRGAGGGRAQSKRWSGGRRVGPRPRARWAPQQGPGNRL